MKKWILFILSKILGSVSGNEGKPIWSSDGGDTLNSDLSYTSTPSISATDTDLFSDGLESNGKTVSPDIPVTEQSNSAERPGAWEFFWNGLTGNGLTRREWDLNELNVRQADIAYERQKEMFDTRQSMQAKVEQAKQAGLNPYAVVGGVSSGSVSSAPQASAAASASSPIELMSLLANLIFRGKELQLMQMETESRVNLNNANANLAGENAVNKSYENERAQEFYRLRNEDLSAAIDKKQKESTNIAENTAFTIVKKGLAEIDKDYYAAINENRKKAFDALYKLQQNQADMSDDQKEMLHYEASQYAYRYGLELKNIIANTALANANAEQVRYYTELFYKSPGLDENGKKRLARFAEMTDAEIDMMLKDKKGKTWRNWIGTVSGAAAGLMVGAGALSRLFPASGAASALMAPIAYPGLQTNSSYGSGAYWYN